MLIRNISLVVALCSAPLLSAMDSPRTDSPRSPRPEQFLHTPFAQMLRDYGWHIAVVDEPLQKGMHLPLTPKRLKKVEYRSPAYVLDVNRQTGVRTLTLTLSFDGGLHMVTALAPHSTELINDKTWRCCSSAVDDALADGSLKFNAEEQSIWERIKTAIELASYTPTDGDEQAGADPCGQVLLTTAIVMFGLACGLGGLGS